MFNSNRRRLNFGAPAAAVTAATANELPKPAPTTSSFDFSKSLFSTEGLTPTAWREELEHRLRDCGTYHQRWDMSKGKFKTIRYRCGCWRDGCKFCLHARAMDLKWRVIRGGGDTVVEWSKEEASKLISTLNKDGTDYLRLPTESSDLLFFDGTGYSVKSDLEIDDVDWENAAMTPKGRRFSGDLGRQPEKRKPDGPCIVLDAPCAIVEAGENHTLGEAWEKAVEETKDLLPECDAEQLEECTVKRVSAFKKAVLSGGGRVFCEYTVRQKVWVNAYNRESGWAESLIHVEQDAWDLDHPDVPF